MPVKSTRLTTLRVLQPHLQFLKDYVGKDRENPFSCTVLIGNWFEERFESKRDDKAIAPGIYGESQCIHDTSVYTNDFKQPIKTGHSEGYEEYLKWKQQGFANGYYSRQPNIKLCDGDQFKNNFTTLADIMYRVVPQQEKNITETSLGKRKLNDDYMRSFGNSTNTGLLRWKQCAKRRENHQMADVSHYKSNFKPIKIIGKKIMRKAPQSSISF